MNIYNLKNNLIILKILKYWKIIRRNKIQLKLCQYIVSFIIAINLLQIVSIFVTNNFFNIFNYTTCQSIDSPHRKIILNLRIL